MIKDLLSGLKDDLLAKIDKLDKKTTAKDKELEERLNQILALLRFDDEDKAGKFKRSNLGDDDMKGTTIGTKFYATDGEKFGPGEGSDVGD